MKMELDIQKNVSTGLFEYQINMFSCKFFFTLIFRKEGWRFFESFAKVYILGANLSFV